MGLSSRLLNKTAKVYTKSKGSVNEFGERSFSLSTSISTLKCTVQPLRESLEIKRAGKTYVVTKVVYCDYRTDINPDDIIEIDNEQYLIVAVEDDGGRQHHLKIYIVKSE